MTSSERPSEDSDQPIQYDPAYLNSLRELKFVIGIGALALAWTVTYGGLFGYAPDADSEPLVMGMPSWVAWGIALPWAVTSLGTLLFAMYVIREDDDDLLESKSEIAQTQQDASPDLDSSQEADSPAKGDIS